MNSISDEFANEERLIRAVWPPENEKFTYLWDGTRVSSAAFKDQHGLSVNRTGNRTLNESLKETRRQFKNRKLVSVTVQNCYETDALPVYRPGAKNIYHSEIHKNKEETRLSPRQAKYLAKRCVYHEISDL